MSNKALTTPAGDPRRPADVVKYVEPIVLESESTDNPMVLVAVMTGMLGLFLKVRIMSWAALFLTLSVFATTKTKHLDFKQIIATVMFSISGIMTGYLTKFKPNAMAQAAAAGAGRAGGA